MNREILFRGKRKNNGKWIEGYYVDADCMNVPFDEPDTGKRYFSFIKVDPETVGQYVNLHDKNGNKVFDGDISKDEQGRLWVIFSTKGGYATCTKKEWKETVMKGLHPIMFEAMADLQASGYFEQTHKIIGNIHDSPELGVSGDGIKNS